MGTEGVSNYRGYSQSRQQRCPRSTHVHSSSGKDLPNVLLARTSQGPAHNPNVDTHIRMCVWTYTSLAKKPLPVCPRHLPIHRSEGGRWDTVWLAAPQNTSLQSIFKSSWKMELKDQSILVYFWSPYVLFILPRCIFLKFFKDSFSLWSSSN